MKISSAVSEFFCSFEQYDIIMISEAKWLIPFQLDPMSQEVEAISRVCGIQNGCHSLIWS